MESPLNSIAIRKMALYMVTAPNIDTCLSYLLDEANPVRVVMAEAPILQVLTSSPPYCGPVIVGTLVAQGYYSFPVRKGHPLAPFFSEAILTMMEGLETGDIVGSFFNGGGCAGGGSSSGAAGDDLPVIGVEDMGGVFIATIIIVISSWCLLGLELVVWRHKEAKGRAGKIWRSLFKFCGGHYFVDAYDAEDKEAESAYVENVGGGTPLTESKKEEGDVAVVHSNPLNVQQEDSKLSSSSPTPVIW